MNPTTETITTPGNGHGTAIESVLEALLADIMRGTYPPGARLPAERELRRLTAGSGDIKCSLGQSSPAGRS